MNQYRLAVTCPCCDETILGNVVADFTNPKGVVLLDMFACEAFVCENCGATVITGDADCMYEVEEPDEIMYRHIKNENTTIASMSDPIW